MAVEGVNNSDSTKRKREFTKPKLLIDERVEVRSVEEGFLGSWHPGKVICCKKLKRYVKYDNVLRDDGLKYFVEVVNVSDALDGDSSSSDFYIRGSIRPPPPLVEFERCELKFGLCVDAKHDEAWWEGVIFDHCDGMEERRVFFPDLGDEMTIRIDQLRITQDWDEVSNTWERRGNWVFLELIEEYQTASLVAVSTKQIWYDIRIKQDFDMIKEWTLNLKYLWRDLVMKVVSDYLTFTLEEVLSRLDLPRALLKETPELESVEPTINVDFNRVVDKANTQAIVNSGSQLSGNTNVHCDGSPNNAFGSGLGTPGIPMEKGDLSNLMDTVQNYEKYDMDPLVDGEPDMHNMADLNMSISEKEILVLEEPVSPVQVVLPEFQKEISCHDAGEVVSGASFEKNGKHRCSTLSDWKPLILSEVKFCPEAVKEYALGYKGKAIGKYWKEKVQKHLAYLGWEIEWSKRKNGSGRHYRYKLPDKQCQKVYMSLIEVCKVMQEDSNMNSLRSQNDQSMKHSTVDNHLSHVLLNQSEKIQDIDIFPPTVPPPPVKVVDEPEFCPQAVVEYYSRESVMDRADKKKWILKARKHLLAEGWILTYPPPTNKKRGMLYRSPENQRFYSLYTACSCYIQESIPKWTTYGMQPLNVSVINVENGDQVWGGDLLRRVSQLLPKEIELHTANGGASSSSTRKRKRKHLMISKTSQLKCQSNGLPLRVLRSSKRVQKLSAPCLSHHKPQNVLSWLIDSNMVLPRSKVYYQVKGRHHAVAEGRISRDGIKCNCCQTVYSLVGFEYHARNISTRRPAASIFLEDGRSLLDCQIQIMQDHRTRETMEKPCSDLCQGENDYICSVCHYGGELILCDQCPSSFHKMCLGLEDIPDGDWFCPSCRCGICGQSKIDGDEDGHFLNCIQCEHKYHVRCLGNGAEYKSRRYLENWFCGKDCEKIYRGLHKLLGEPISVGVGNLTWTLVKSITSESCGLSSTENDLMAENHSKLNVALSVMHECFEPLQEPFSSRDLTDDVIFSRWSALNRLNFKGFYTVLLERNEELISVATVRVYGRKVAEVPLVGTRLQYRRHGMCRILMNELEKTLMQLGVERLVLPAVPSVLATWTGSFGFEKMTCFERSQFLDCTFLDFQGTIMCQKLLMRVPSPDSVLSIESQHKPYDVFSRSCSVNFGKSSPASEVCQAKEIVTRGMLDHQMGDTCAGNNDQLGGDTVDLVTMVKQTSPEEQQSQNGTSLQCSHVKQTVRFSDSCMYYRRRKVKKVHE